MLNWSDQTTHALIVVVLVILARSQWRLKVTLEKNGQGSLGPPPADR